MGKASDYRKRKEGREPTVDLALPSGATFTLRRPPLEVWTVSGKIPQALISARTRESGTNCEIGDDELLASIVFVRDALLYACVSPKLIPPTPEDDLAGRRELGDDELWADELDPEDFEYLANWIKSGCPGVPVKTKGGEVSLDDLSRFRQKRAGGKPFSLEPDSGEVQPEAERIARHS